MELAKFKKAVQKMKDIDESPNWYIINGPGDKFIHMPPYSYLKVNEGEGWVESVYYENQQALGDPITLNIVDIDDIVLVGTHIEGAKYVRKYLKDDIGMSQEDVEKVINIAY